MCSQAGVVKKLQEKLWSQNLIRYVLELKPVCNSHQDGLRENGVKWRKRNAVSSFGTRDLYKKATSNQGDWWQEEILPITQLLQESIFWDPTSSERPISLEKKGKMKRSHFFTTRWKGLRYLIPCVYFAFAVKGQPFGTIWQNSTNRSLTL